MIPVREAAKLLGFDTSTLFQPYMSKYLVKSSRGKRDAKFNVTQYRKDKELESQMIAKTTLFIEYLRHIEEVTYQQVAKNISTSANNISDHRISMKLAVKLARYYRDNEEDKWIRFHEFYNWHY